MYNNKVATKKTQKNPHNKTRNNGIFLCCSTYMYQMPSLTLNKHSKPHLFLISWPVSKWGNIHTQKARNKGSYHSAQLTTRVFMPIADSKHALYASCCSRFDEQKANEETHTLVAQFQWQPRIPPLKIRTPVTRVFSNRVSSPTETHHTKTFNSVGSCQLVKSLTSSAFPSRLF